VATGQGVRIRYVAELDGLRGAAVAAVLLFHGGHLRGGYLGVDLFFVLSGYLITSLLLAESGKRGRIALGAFWSRRARRLLPALGLMLIGVALYAKFVAQPADLRQIRLDGLATIGYVANWRYVLEHFSYWSLFTSPSPLQHTWSLAIEEQFYIVWPLVMVSLLWLGGRRSEPKPLAQRVLVLSLALAVVSLVLAILLYRIDGSNRVYYGTDTRAAAILLGAALAATMSLRGPARTRGGRTAVEVAGLAGVVILALAWLRLDGTSPLLYEGGLFACSLAAVAVIAAATHPTRGPVAMALKARPLVLLGLISYGVYLFHWPIFLWMSSVTGLHGWVLFGVQVAVTLAVSIISFLAVERPIRHGAFHAPSLRLLVPVAAAVLVVSLVGATAGYKAASATAPGNDSLAAVLRTAQGQSGQPRLLVVGNSVPYFLAREGFEQLTTRPSLLVVNGALPDCSFPSGTTGYRINGGTVVPVVAECAANWVTDVNAFRPDVVLFTIGDILGELQRDGQWLRPCTPAFDNWFASSLHQAADVFTRYGAHLVVATSAYSDYVFAPTNLWPQTDCLNRIERTAAAWPNTSVVDLGHYVCPSITYCRQTIDGVPLRPDGLHYRNRSAEAIAAWLVPRLGLRSANGQPVTIVSSRPVG
jgi:peptidoglycan/LPS O-acetylase OafA/YrhL